MLKPLSHLHHLVRSTPWLGRAVLKSIPDLKWKIDVKPIGRMNIRLRQHRMYWLRSPLTFERYMLGALQRLVRKGDVVYDIGANIGLYSRFIAQCFGASQVYAFEPMEDNLRLLRQNLELGGCASHVTVLPWAVANEDGADEFQVDDLTSNSGSLDIVRHGRASQSREQYNLPPRKVRVPVVRLDSLVQSNKIASPNLIKLDIEGAEALALEGATTLLSHQSCRLVIELHGPDVAKRVLEFLWGLDYHCAGLLLKNGDRTHATITRDDLIYVTSMYSLSHLIASRNPDEVSTPIHEFVEEV